MKNKFKALTALTLATALGAFAGCTSTTGPTTTTTAGAPTAVMVNSLGSSSIGVMWTRDSTDLTPDTVMAVPSDGSAMQMLATSSTATSYVLTGLNNTTYTISVKSSGASSSPIVWAPATRYPTVTLYETADPASGHPSGLDLNPNDHAGTVAAVSVSASSAERTMADVVLASDPTVTPSFISLVSAGVTGSGIAPADAKPCLFNSSAVYVAGGLDNDYYMGNLSSLIPGTGLLDPNAYTSQDFDATVSATGTKDLIIRVKATRGSGQYYARLDIVRQANGLLYKTDANGKHSIDVVVSESNTSMFPYASRGTVNYPATIAKHPSGAPTGSPN